MRKPLKGFTLLDVGTMTPGKYCSYLLADLGADVIRIERPISGTRPVDDEDLVLNQGKRSITLNLRSDAGRNLFLDLAATADVILESNRPGAADRNGFGYSAITARNPGIIYCALSGYGATGPLSQAPGYDLLFAAQCGMLKALTGKDSIPRPPDTYLADAVAGLTAAYAIVVALLGRERERSSSETGAGAETKGVFIDLAMHDSIFAILAVSHGLRRPGAQADRAADAAMPTYAIYEAADNAFIALGAIRPSSSGALFAALGRPELAEPGADQQEIAAFLSQTFITKPAHAWVAELAPLDIEIALVVDPMAAFDDPQLRARGMIDRSTHPEAGELETIQPLPVMAQSAEKQTPTPAPGIGADTESILKSLGLDKAAITELAEQGAI